VWLFLSGGFPYIDAMELDTAVEVLGVRVSIIELSKRQLG
jgi:hypothetical protein